jgi:hypothetical protein
MTDTYSEFIQSKAQSGADRGFDPVFMPPALFDFQRSLVEWAVRRGIGIELKESYFKQAIKNMEIAVEDTRAPDQAELFNLDEAEGGR